MFTKEKTRVLTGDVSPLMLKVALNRTKSKFLNMSILVPNVPDKLCLAKDSEPTRNDKGIYSKHIYCLLFCLEIFCSNINDSSLIKVTPFCTILFVFTVIFHLFALSSLITIV